MADNLFKLLPGSVMVVVPKPGERAKITLDTHRGMGHFGVQRVLDRLQKNYWWRGMGDAVVETIRFLPFLRKSEGGGPGVGKGAPALASEGARL